MSKPAKLGTIWAATASIYYDGLRVARCTDTPRHCREAIEKDVRVTGRDLHKYVAKTFLGQYKLYREL